jgi:hypothetical protein
MGYSRVGASSKPPKKYRGLPQFPSAVAAYRRSVFFVVFWIRVTFNAASVALSMEMKRLRFH